MQDEEIQDVGAMFGSVAWWIWSTSRSGELSGKGEAGEGRGMTEEVGDDAG